MPAAKKIALDLAKKKAFADLARGIPLKGLAVPRQTVILVSTAQGILDNGGLQYFFESDFPEKPPYSLFIDAYERIGAADAADALKAAVALFNFPQPHRHKTKRNSSLSRFQRRKTNPLKPFDAVLSGHKKIWKLLEAYAQQNL
ncbi:MAG TPA: DUF4375 domain-containing protein [Phycisphaerae bacterium]|nr:DUF4375 domain-containing protein [Phycisphaerae bacterium]